MQAMSRLKNLYLYWLHISETIYMFLNIFVQQPLCVSTVTLYLNPLLRHAGNELF